MTKNLKQKDFAGEIVALNAYVRDNIRYTRDVLEVETLQTPEATLELGAGDCDDKATLLASLFLSIGHRPRFIALRRDGKFCHVWTQVQFGGKWINCETTEPVALGDMPPFKRGDNFLSWPI